MVKLVNLPPTQFLCLLLKNKCCMFESLSQYNEEIKELVYWRLPSKNRKRF